MDSELLTRLGVLARIDIQDADALRSELSDMLASVSRIKDKADGEAPVPAGVGLAGLREDLAVPFGARELLIEADYFTDGSGRRTSVKTNKTKGAR